MSSVFFVLEILGIIAFSISGALVAIKAKFDLFGVTVVGIITAVGGGVTRDIIAGHTPPLIFFNAHLLGIAFLSALITFLFAYSKRNKFELIQEKIEVINNYFDAIGLATFTVMGVETAFTYGLSTNVILSITMGVLTGVGGGLLRDLFTETKPYIFTKHIYAIASIAGAGVFYVLRLNMPQNILPTILGFSATFLLRVFATRFRWKLPIAQIK